MFAARTEARWRSLCHSLHASEAATQKWWNVLRDAYGGPDRHYHSLEHIDAMLGLATAYGEEIEDREAVDLAIFFHDVIYDAKDGGGGANERLSAAKFSDFAAEAVNAVALSQRRRAKIVAWIELTYTHRCGEDVDGDGRLFMDFDMSILAADRETYLRYARNVRREYAHVPGVAWRVGRSRFLASAASPTHSVFSSTHFAAREADARRNANAEKWRLRGELAAQAAAGLAAVGAAYVLFT